MNARLNRPVSCLITIGDSTARTFLEKKKIIIDTVVRAADSSVSLVQIREKELSARQIYEIAAAAVDAAAGTGTLILVNDRFDLALAAGAAGVHLRSNSTDVRVVRSVVPDGFIVGVSTHCLDEVLSARDGGADYAIFGPVFTTPGKPAAVGLGELTRVCEAAFPFPVLALGGIDENSARSVIDAGAAGFAAIRFMNSNDGFEFAGRMRDAE